MPSLLDLINEGAVQTAAPDSSPLTANVKGGRFADKKMEWSVPVVILPGPITKAEVERIARALKRKTAPKRADIDRYQRVRDLVACGRYSRPEIIRELRHVRGLGETTVHLICGALLHR